MFDRMNPEVGGADTDSLQERSGQDEGVEEVESRGVEVMASSSAGIPPPYSRKAPLNNPFRDYTDEEPALPTTTMLIGPLPAVTTDNTYPFSHEMVLGEGLAPPLPPRPGLSRGLQIPSRVSLITWGFSFPNVLPEQGVSKEQWRLFKSELESFANLTLLQHFTVIGCGFLVHHILGILPG